MTLVLTNKMRRLAPLLRGAGDTSKMNRLAARLERAHLALGNTPVFGLRAFQEALALYNAKAKVVLDIDAAAQEK